MNDWPNPSTFTVSPWGQPQEPVAPIRPDFADDVELKKAYGLALGRGLDLFNAGMEIFTQDLPKALWVSTNWLNDPIVHASKDAYLNTLKTLSKPLDKEELLAKILELAEERDITGVPLVEAKERINALKLYSEVAGFTGKINIDASTNTFTETNNLMKIVLVKPEEKTNQLKTIEASNIKSKIHNEELPPIKLKLVGNG